MNELANIYRGKSLSVGFTIPAAYDESRIEDLKVNIGTKVYQHTIVQGVIGVNLTSNDTAKMVGRQDVVLTIEDSLFGVQKINCGYVYVSSTISKFQSESYSSVYDVMIMLSFYDNSLDVDHVLFDYLKGKSAYEYAVDGGYLGTEEQFYLDLAKAAIAVPYTGADKDVDLGENSISAESVILEGVPAAPVTGEMWYDPDTDSVAYKRADGGITNVNQEPQGKYVNIDTVALTNGMVVSTAGIAGNRKGVKRTDFTDIQSIRNIVGMVTVTSIAVNQSGMITKAGGIINDVNTNGWAEGSQLWGNPAVLGGWTINKPAKGSYAVQIGQIVVAHSVNGSIEFNPVIPLKFGDLDDVSGTTTSIVDTDTIPKRGSDGIIKEITVANVKADFKADTDLLYEPLLGFTPENAANKGQANGYASLGADGLVPSNQLPSFVDDVLEFANLASFPATGEQGKIYVALDTNKTYRWSGSTYIYITSGAVDSVAGKTGIVTLDKNDVGLSNVDNTSDVNKPVSTAQANAIATKVSLTGNETIAGIKTFSSSPIVPNPTTSNQALNKGTGDSTYVALTGAQNIAGVKTFTESPIVPTPVNNTDAANKAFVQSVITVGNDTYQENKLITDARVASLENTINSANINQEVTTTATGVDTVSLPKTAANTGMQVQLFGDSDATKNVFGTGRVRSVGANLIKPTYIQGFQVSTVDGTFVAGSTFSRSDYFRVAASTAYVLSSNTNTGTDHRIAFYDSAKVFISGATQTSGQPISVTSPANAYYCIVSSLTTKVDTFRLTRGTASFEPYRESILQLTTPELRSNGLIKDEIRKGTKGYELVKRVGVGTLGSELIVNGGFDTDTTWLKQAGWTISGGSANYDATANTVNIRQAITLEANSFYEVKFTVLSGTARININTINGGNIGAPAAANYATGSHIVRFKATATNGIAVYAYNADGGTAFSLDNFSVKKINASDGVISDTSVFTVLGSNVHYTLATPTISPIAHAGLLNSNSNGTAYFEPIIADAGVYSSNLAIQLTDYPISSFESIRKYANGTYTELSTATAVIASGGLSFTHPDLASGDLVMFTYAYNKDSIGRSMTLSYAISNSNPYYNVTNSVPLTTGYYTSTTARAAVPEGVRKTGLILTYETAAGAWYTERYIGTATDTTSFTNAANWEVGVLRIAAVTDTTEYAEITI